MLYSIYRNTVFFIQLIFRMLFGTQPIKTTLFNELAEHNILIIKLFQTIAPIYATDLQVFTNQVPVSDYELISLKHAAISAFNSSNKPSENISRVKLLNAGSIAAVFETSDNSAIVIKVLRTNIRNKLQYQLEELCSWLHILAFIVPTIGHLMVSATHCSNILMEQTRIDIEHQNLCDIYNKMSAIPYCHFPKPIGYYNETMFMSKLHGHACTVEYINNASDELRIKWATNLTKFGIVSALIHGIAHGDLHAGNILLYDDGTIGLVDFGIVCRFSKEFCNDMLSFLMSLTELNETATTDELANKVGRSKLFRSEKQCNIDAINAALKTFVSGSSEIILMVYKLFDIIAIEDISDEFKQLQLTMLTTQGISMKLCAGKHIEIIRLATNELFTAFYQ